jgi:death on curing protein
VFFFLTFDDVLEAHATVLANWGGADGIRDEGAIRSAVAQPEATFACVYLHEDVFAMGAAYAYHIAEAQAFLDGNKRTAVLAAVTFLDMNGFRVGHHDDILYLAMFDISARTLSKSGLADLLRQLAG